MTELFEPLTKPTAAQLNTISDSQTALEATFGAASAVLPVRVGGSAEDRHVIRHQFRWLCYTASGQIEDLSGVNEPTALSSEPGDDQIFDLRTVGWLAVGVFYRVTGCELAYERSEAPVG
jgi:hypothetical protein